MTCGAAAEAAAPAIVVYSLAQSVAALEAAAEAGVRVLLLSAAEAGLSCGAGWWREMIAAACDSVPRARSGTPGGALLAGALLDCGADAGAAQAALREGVEAIVFSGRDDVAERLAEIAAASGSRVRRARPLPLLDPGDDCFASPEALRRRVAAALRSEGAGNRAK